jgi:5-methylcytosine-specific restriction endonuclease McrA
VKQCTRCKQMFPATTEYFSRHKGMRDGLNYVCKLCVRKYYLRNRELIYEKQLDWQRNNRSKDIMYEHRRKALLRENFVEDVDIEQLYLRDEGTCQLCKQPCSKAEWSIDHIIPLSRGGEHSYENTQLAHRSCNSRKGNKILEE